MARSAVGHVWALVRQWWPLLVGNVLEWYEFGVYGSLTEQLSANFFRASAIGTWSGFALTFLLRPVGGIVFGMLADRVGRKSAVLWSMRGMLFATVAQGLLPSLHCCGEASADVGMVLLIILRAMQGVCTGGEIGPLVTYLAESSPPGMLGVGTVLFLVCAEVAFLISSSFVALLVLVLGEERMLVWGWRVPFLIALVPGLLTLWGRSHLPESADFVKLQGERDLKLQKKSSMPPADVQANQSSAGGNASAEQGSEATSASTEDAKSSGASSAGGSLGSNVTAAVQFLRDYGYSLFIGFSVAGAGGAAMYIGMWCGPHLVKQGGLDQASALGVSSLMYVVATIVAFASGAICDIYFGSDPFVVQAVSSGLLAVAGIPVFWGINAYPGSLWVTVLCLSVVLGIAQSAALAPCYNLCPRLFPTHVRALGFGLTFNLAMAYVGGTAALVAQALDGLSPIAPGAYLSALGLLSACAALWGLRLRRSGHLRCHDVGDAAPKGGAQETEEQASAAAAASAV